jgi:hypothetical protein
MEKLCYYGLQGGAQEKFIDLFLSHAESGVTYRTLTWENISGPYFKTLGIG